MFSNRAWCIMLADINLITVITTNRYETETNTAPIKIHVDNTSVTAQNCQHPVACKTPSARGTSRGSCCRVPLPWTHNVEVKGGWRESFSTAEAGGSPGYRFHLELRALCRSTARPRGGLSCFSQPKRRYASTRDLLITGLMVSTGHGAGPAISEHYSLGC